ncbi:glutamate ABC transporter substrate-binding protein [Umezawaea sp. NPDC059074]|uniref:glutamate ABC transporter substrate-binding protein n=1 Tax=Umezawaea sp. NPDC059074 TaxID=3346716 RepID=UPI0036922135
MKVVGRRLVGLTFVVAVLVAGCGDEGSSRLLRHGAEGTLTIGVTDDQPGSSLLRVDGKYRGFDVDVATYVAGRLGVSADRIVWRPVQLADREDAIESGRVDLVVAGYSITEERKRRVGFAGPYFVAGQDLLVLNGEKGITGPEALDGRTLCSAKGTTSAARIKASFARGVRLVEKFDFSECVTGLLVGEVDAVTTDNLILAGYVAKNPELLRIVGKTFSEELYGVGLKKGDVEGRDAVDAALRRMVEEGEWKKALGRNFPGTGFEEFVAPEVGRV